MPKPSPQEQFVARRGARLPPGLVNHGNTCFMNSVLQALVATRDLERLVRLNPAAPVASHRSPVLASAHRDRDRPTPDPSPIATHLLAVLNAAWDIQDNHRRENISPRDLLAAMGKKYDQYLEFFQQDAHEFLCQLLDAIRMEEIDIIKQRSPPQKKPSKRPRRHRSLPDGELPFVDMLFGGQLASILVCQTCKHVSHTYEDFGDLSLSIKPEDYVRERKRDRLKQFAKKIGTAFYVATPLQRSSSVPATPVHDSRLDSDPQRRRSIDLADVDTVVDPAPARADAPVTALPPSVPDTPSLPGTPTDVPLPVPVPDPPVPVPHPEPPTDHPTTLAPDRVNGKDKRDRDESWAKISRRISVTVGLTRRPKPDRKDKKGIPSGTPSRLLDDASPVQHAPSALVPSDAVNGAASPHPHHEREPTPLGLVNEKLQAQLTSVKRSVMPTPRAGHSPSNSSAPRFPLISRPSSPGAHSKSSKTPRPPKLGAQEAAYLRDILADINPPNVQKPFSIFKQSKEPSSSSAFYTQNVFLKVNQINKIEECLRLFTSVEVLDGDNTVRCHRCWKIANGFYKPRPKGSAQGPDSCSDTEDDEAVDAKSHAIPDSIPVNLAIPALTSSNAASPSHSITSLHDTQASRDTPPALTQRSSSSQKPVPPSLQLNDRYPIELVSPIRDDTPSQRSLPVPPSLSTAPESPMSIQTAKPVLIRENAASSVATEATEHLPRMSLGAPPDQHRYHMPRSGDSNTESEISEGESETLPSVYSDVSSALSTNASPNASRDQLQQHTPTSDDRPTDKRHPSGVPRSRQYILRPAYKRYLIATPPPILVVHLKRFQQLSKAPVVSFSTGFKKLDDYISFPEYLDLAPYLAPRREDYFESKVAMMRGRARRPAPCMYRLYAVVVHIGNMLGGHYVAYTALPPPPPSEGKAVPPEGEKQRTENGPATRDWAFISDTIVRLSSLEEALKSRAYICMYERI